MNDGLIGKWLARIENYKELANAHLNSGDLEGYNLWSGRLYELADIVSEFTGKDHVWGPLA